MQFAASRSSSYIKRCIFFLTGFYVRVCAPQIPTCTMPCGGGGCFEKDTHGALCVWRGVRVGGVAVLRVRAQASSYCNCSPCHDHSHAHAFSVPLNGPSWASKVIHSKYRKANHLIIILEEIQETQFTGNATCDIPGLFFGHFRINSIG